MHPNAPRRIPAVLDVIPFSGPSGDLAWVRCVKCSKSLELHQPDNDFPERLLGVCTSCRNWTLIELVADEAEAVMVLLPEGGWALTASRGHEATQSANRGTIDMRLER